MKCRKCGELVSDFALTCPVCGASLTKDISELLRSESKTKVNPEHFHQEDCSVRTHAGRQEYDDRHSNEVRSGRSAACEGSSRVGILQALALFFRRYVDFRGRSGKSEYWWAILVIYFVNMVLSSAFPEFGSLLSLVTLLPTVSLNIRRLHDVGRSGWWYLLVFVPFGAFVVLFWACKASDPEPNQWGYPPRY